VDAATRERDAVAADRDALAAERANLTSERDGASASQNALLAERDALLSERDTLLSDRDTLALERDALAATRDAVTAERDRLAGERVDFVRTHDAMVLQRDTLVHERDDIMRDRDRQIAELHASMAAVRETTIREAATGEAPEKAAAKAPASPTGKPVGKKAAAPGGDGPIRKTDRQAFSNALGVQIDGEAALLVDLSVTGAQVLSCAALKPAKTVKMLLPSSDAPVLCRGRIVWARLEPTIPGRPIRYRAGMFFTATDQSAVQTFIARHGARTS
jgi:hypothetical protein